MKKHRKWDSKTKAKVVLEGFKGKKVVDICNENGICQTQYYTWRDQFFKEIEAPFETVKKTSKEVALGARVKELEGLVGQLTLELKKSEEELW